MGTKDSPWRSRLTDEEYRQLSLLVAERAGICLGSGVRKHITQRVWQQMAQLGMAHFSDFVRYTEDGTHDMLFHDLCKDLNFAHFSSRSLRQQIAFVNEWACDSAH